MPSYLISGSDGARGSSIIWPNMVALLFHLMSAVLAERPASVSSCACNGVVAMTCNGVVAMTCNVFGFFCFFMLFFSFV